MRLIFFSLLLFLIPKISQAACSSPVGSAGQLQWISADSQIKFCDGTNWKENNHGTLDSCSGVTAGTVNFNSAASDLRYCNGANWISMKGAEIASCSGTPAGTFTWDLALSTMKYCDGTDWRDMGYDPCPGTPLGTECPGGAIFLGILNGNKYMTTPGGCGDIPVDKIGGGSGTTAYPNADFTPDCSGTDHLTKTWRGNSTNFDILGLRNSDVTQLGDENTSILAGITAAAEGGYHAAARYCDKLVFGGYSDWYLPNSAELMIFWTNSASITDIDKTGAYYWSSTEQNWSNVSFRSFSVNSSGSAGKGNVSLVRCVRRF